MNESFYYREELAERERERQHAQMDQPPTEVPAPAAPMPTEDPPAAEIEIAAPPPDTLLTDTFAEAEASTAEEPADPPAPTIDNVTPEDAAAPTDLSQDMGPIALPPADATDLPTDPRIAAIPPAVPAIRSAVTLHVVVALEDDEPFSALLPVVTVPKHR